MRDLTPCVLSKNRKLPVLQRFKDGSYLSQISPAPATLRKMSDKTATAITVRVIDYHLPGVADAEPVYRLITTLLDSEQYPPCKGNEILNIRQDWTPRIVK